MCDCRYFYPDGEEITDKMQFIEFYSKVYCYENHKHWDLELEMEKLLKHDKPLSGKDIASILLWKTNGTPEKSRNGEFRIKDFGRTIIIRDELREAHEFKRLNEPKRNRNETNEIDEDNEKEFVRHLVKFYYLNPKSSGEDGERTGIGFVYAITLLFFVTKGAYPIYDRYAHVGLKSVMEGGNPTDKQYKITEKCYRNNMFHSPYRKTDKNGKKVVYEPSIDRAWEDYLEYKRLLMAKEAFGDVYEKQGFHYRDIDRAIWAYGHLFYVS